MMHQITDSLAVGNISDAERPPATIGAVLLVAEEFSIEAPAGLIYSKIPLKEYGEADIVSLDRAVTWIEQQLPENRVMVCCRAGMGRSVSVAMAYLCCVQGLAYPDVWELAMTRRPGAVPLPNLRATIERVQQLRRTRKQTMPPSA
jgi:protein-tyrosine phosphatase